MPGVRLKTRIWSRWIKKTILTPSPVSVRDVKFFSTEIMALFLRFFCPSQDISLHVSWRMIICRWQISLKREEGWDSSLEWNDEQWMSIAEPVNATYSDSNHIFQVSMTAANPWNVSLTLKVFQEFSDEISAAKRHESVCIHQTSHIILGLSLFIQISWAFIKISV